MSVASPLNQLAVLRKKLDLMGYHEPLPLEAVPLVALLFRDFLQLTESLNNVKTEHSKLLKLKENFEDNVEPYKEENTKLIKENNELHQEIMKMKEHFESSLLDVKAKAKKMEDENTNLKFLNNQYLRKTRNFKQVTGEELEVMPQEQNAEVAMQIPGDQRSKHLYHQQYIELTKVLQPLTGKLFYQRMKEHGSETHTLDLLHLSASTIVKLQNENAELLEATEQAHETVRSLEEKVDLRDKEIVRLTVQLNLGKPLQVVCLETQERKKDEVIQNLHQQLQSLYQQNEELEKIIIKYCGKEYLPEKVRPSALYNFLDTVCGIEKEGFSRHLEKTAALDKPVQHEDTLSSAKYTQHINRLEKGLRLANLEKRKLAEKIAMLLGKEKQLQSEISRLKRKVSPHGASPSQCSERLARLVQVLEAQRDFFKEECETLKRLQGKKDKIPCKLGEKSSSDTKISEITTKDGESSQFSRKRSFVNLVEEERDFYKEKYCRLLERHGNVKEELCKTTADKEIMVTDDTLQKLRKENFELLQRLRELEHQNTQNHYEMELAESGKQKLERKNLEKAIAQLQNTVEELEKKLEKTSKEKQIFMQKYQQAVTENSKLREETSAKADTVLSELTPTVYTNAIVQEKIKEIEQHECKAAILHQQIEVMQKALTDLKRENEAVKTSLASHKAMVSSLEHQISSLNCQLSKAIDESDEHKTAAEQIRILIGHGEQSAEELQLSLIQKEGELNIAEKKIKTLENDAEELKGILKHCEAEINDLKSATVRFEEEKEELTTAINEKNLQLSSLQQQIYSKELHASELKITSSALEADVEKVQGEVRLKNEEIGSLKEQLQSKSKHVEELSCSLDVLRREHSRLLEELSLLTKQNQFVTEEMENKLQELEELKRKDVEYVAELSRLQEVLSIKDQQRSELIKQYKDLSYENNRLETETRRMQCEAEAAQMELQAKDAELQGLRTTSHSLEKEIEQYLSAQEAHHLEMTFLNSSVSELEAELHQKQQEIRRLQMELTESRSLSVQIDASREHLQKMLADESTANVKLTSELEVLRDEMQAVRTQLSSERASMVTMESLMATHREKEFRSHLMNQELNAEISVLRNRLKESLEKVETLTKELSILRTKISEMEVEKERLKRDITDERYERERDHNELLRLQHLQQLYVSEPALKSSALHSKFTSPRLFKSLPSQETVPVSFTSEVEAFNKTQPEVSFGTHASSVAAREASQPSLVQATASELGTSEESRQTWSKVTSQQVSSSKTLSHKIDSMEQPEKEPLDSRISSCTSPKDLPSDDSPN